MLATTRIQSLRNTRRIVRLSAPRIQPLFHPRTLPTTHARPYATETDDRAIIEAKVRAARQQFRDILPRGHLSEAECVVYERLYGEPVFVDTVEETEIEATEEVEDELEVESESPVLLRRDQDGGEKEVEYSEFEQEDSLEQEEDDQALTAEEWEELREERAQMYHDEVYEKSRLAQDNVESEVEEEDPDDAFMRAHPLTVAGRFRPSPSTVFLPKETLTDPTTMLLTRANHKHLTESANRIFGGRGLPYSASTAPARLAFEQKPIALDAAQSDMGQIEADAYMAAVQPGVYASVMSALVEVRRRLGSPWMEHMLAKQGGNVLDAGSGGVGVLAWHEVLRAENDARNEQAGTDEPAPRGKATVLVAADTLRHRASRLLENTTFIPRLPEHVTPEDEANTSQPRKTYDLIIAPHTLWPIKQDYMRKDQVSRYWSLLNPNGGVLILIEKGLPRGFEVVAGARSMLLERFISSPNSTSTEVPLEQQVGRPDDEGSRFHAKETGMIIAPCTNHLPCPMYTSPGFSPGRKDFCHFTQRYIRPPYLQRILGARDRNHEDAQFSYLAVQRGRDQRLSKHDILGLGGVKQDDMATDAAFKGHEWLETETAEDADAEAEEAEDIPTPPSQVHALSLPRLILPPLKRRGHIVLDVCTPSATLERWTVPRSFSKQAFRDAKKSRWGDLWALGAKTRIPRSVRLGRRGDEYDAKGRKLKRSKKVVVEVGVGEQDGRAVDEGARMTTAGGAKRFGDRDGRYSADRKIRGSGGRKGRKKSEALPRELGGDVWDGL